MKRTLLQLVQDISDELDFEEVNSIGDTTTSEQVATIVKNCYFEMIGHRNWPHTKKLFSLESVGAVDKPTHLKLPSKLKELVSLNYTNTDGSFAEITYKDPEAFLRYVSTRNTAQPNTLLVTDFSGLSFVVLKNSAPKYYTSFDDKYVVFDSYDYTEGSTIIAARTLCTGYFTPDWIHEDDFIPDLPDEAFPSLFEEAKSTASLNLKQTIDPKADAKSVRQQRWLSRKAWVANAQNSYPDYGRKR